MNVIYLATYFKFWSKLKDHAHVSAGHGLSPSARLRRWVVSPLSFCRKSLAAVEQYWTTVMTLQRNCGANSHLRWVHIHSCTRECIQIFYMYCNFRCTVERLKPVVTEPKPPPWLEPSVLCHQCYHHWAVITGALTILYLYCAFYWRLQEPCMGFNSFFTFRNFIL